MPLLFIVFLLFAIILKFFPPKKPNYFYGYQLGTAKKSLEHWKLANKYAANYMLFLYSFLIGLSLLLDYRESDNNLIVLSIFILGIIIIYFLIERKLKLKINE